MTSIGSNFVFWVCASSAFSSAKSMLIGWSGVKNGLDAGTFVTIAFNVLMASVPGHPCSLDACGVVSWL